MLEIRPARPEEIPRQKELWKLAFGDDDAYIDYFYQHGEESQVLVLLEDGVVWTMTALFPVTLTLPEGERLSSAYIYALATHPEARKKGFARFLLNYVDYYLQEAGKDCVAIVPAEPPSTATSPPPALSRSAPPGSGPSSGTWWPGPARATPWPPSLPRTTTPSGSGCWTAPSTSPIPLPGGLPAGPVPDGWRGPLPPPASAAGVTV